jgi:hypothetical protein
MMLPGMVSKTEHPFLQSFSELAEGLPVFLDTPAE